MKLFHWVLGFGTVFISGCDLLKFEADYQPITTLLDAKSGYYVELGQLSNMSSLGYAVQVFKDAKPRAGVVSEFDAVIYVSKLEDEDIRLYVRDGCYVLDVRYAYGGLITPVWTDPETGKSICFDVVPERGPKPAK